MDVTHRQAGMVRWQWAIPTRNFMLDSDDDNIAGILDDAGEASANTMIRRYGQTEPDSRRGY